MFLNSIWGDLHVWPFQSQPIWLHLEHQLVDLLLWYPWECRFLIYLLQECIAVKTVLIRSLNFTVLKALISLRLLNFDTWPMHSIFSKYFPSWAKASNKKLDIYFCSCCLRHLQQSSYLYVLSGVKKGFQIIVPPSPILYVQMTREITRSHDKRYIVDLICNKQFAYIR